MLDNDPINGVPLGVTGALGGFVLPASCCQPPQGMRDFIAFRPIPRVINRSGYEHDNEDQCDGFRPPGQALTTLDHGAHLKSRRETRGNRRVSGKSASGRFMLSMMWMCQYPGRCGRAPGPNLIAAIALGGIKAFIGISDDPVGGEIERRLARCDAEARRHIGCRPRAPDGECRRFR